MRQQQSLSITLKNISFSGNPLAMRTHTIHTLSFTSAPIFNNFTRSVWLCPGKFAISQMSSQFLKQHICTISKNRRNWLAQNPGRFCLNLNPVFCSQEGWRGVKVVIWLLVSACEHFEEGVRAVVVFISALMRNTA